jgi:hypothetical protein
LCRAASFAAFDVHLVKSGQLFVELAFFCLAPIACNQLKESTTGRLELRRVGTVCAGLSAEL